MAGALKYRSGATWNYVKGIKGDMGPAGPNTLGVETLTPPGIARARLANRSTGFSLQNPDMVFLNDYTGVDPTGATECSAAIQAAINDAAANKIYTVWCEGGSVYLITSTLSVPRAVTIAGPIRKGQSTYPTTSANKPQFKAGISNLTMFLLVGNASCLQGIALHHGNPTYTGTVGVRPNNSFQIIADCEFEQGDATSTGIRGGGILYTTIRDNMWTTFGGRGIDMLNSYADNPVATYYGINVGWITGNVLGAAAGGLRVDGTSLVVAENDLESNYSNPAMQFGETGSPSTAGEVRDNYFEISGTGTVSQGILVKSMATMTVHDNALGGAGKTVVGSYGIKAESIGATINANSVARFETGIILPTNPSAASPGEVALANAFSLNQNTTDVSGGAGATEPFASTAKIAALQMKNDGRLSYMGAFVGGSVNYLSAGTNQTIDLAKGHLFRVQATAAITVTYTGRLEAYQPVLVMNSGTFTITLPFANWLTREGVDAKLLPGQVRSFMSLASGYGGTTKLVETGPLPVKLPVVQTATFTADTSADCYLCDATTGAITANLPSATTWTGGPLTVKKTDSSANAVTVDPSGTQTVDGATTLALTAQWSAVTMRPNSGNWFVVSKT